MKNHASFGRLLASGALIACACLVSFSRANAGTYEKSYVGEMKTWSAKHEDTFIELARKNNLGFVEMRAANPGIDPWLPGEGTKIIVPSMHLLPNAPRKGIVINLPEMRLFYYPSNGAPPSVYPIGIGREGLNTPEGSTKVMSKIVGPVWRPTPRMREEDPTLPASVPPGPENPLGTHALYLGWSQYRIHGTNKPYGIGRRTSSGCIRMYPEGIIDLFNQVSEGTDVTVVNQPIKLGWVGDELLLEAHTSVEQADQVEMDGYTATFRMDEKDMQRILEAAGEYVDRLDWMTIRKAIRERKGYPVVVAKRPGASKHADNNAAKPVAEPSKISAN